VKFVKIVGGLNCHKDGLLYWFQHILIAGRWRVCWIARENRGEKKSESATSRCESIESDLESRYVHAARHSIC